MPPRWPRKPDRNDPDYRRLDDRMNFAVHVGLFLVATTGSWFFRILKDQSWQWTVWMTGIWATILLCHGLYIFALADYSSADPDGKGDHKPGQAS
jgi:2TM domain